jgi:hypothetical protein
MKTPKFTIIEFNKIDNVEEFTTDVIDISDVVSLNVDFMFSFALTPSDNVEVEVLASQDGINFSNNAIGKFDILTYSLNTRYTRNFSFPAINYIKLKVKVPHVADIKLTGVKEKDISPNLEIKNNLLANLPPTSTDDFSKGYVVGSLWVDNNEKITYVCVDNAVDNSVWTMVKMPDHEINGSQVRFKNPDGSWGNWIVLGGTVLDIENSQIKLKDTADNVLSTININTDLINDTTNNRFVTDNDINRWNDTYTTSTIDSSLNTKVNKTGDVMTGELGLPSFKLGDSNVFYVGGSEIVTMRNWGTEPSTIFSIRALPPKSWKDGEGADFTNVDREATLALIRTDDLGNEEFIDIYNNGYNSSTNQDAMQMGIRIQKRGIGEYRDFVFDRYDGSTLETVLRIKSDKTTEFYEPLSIQGGISDLSGRSLSKNDFTDTLLNKLNGIETGATGDQTAAEILDLIKTVDGSGSGLNADLLDGHDSSYFSVSGHNHDSSYYTQNQINSFLNLKEDLANKGVANGYASLDSNAKVPLNQLPDVSKQATHVVADITERNNLTGLIEGDRAFVTSTGDSYIWNGSSWLLMADADWQNVNLDWANIINVPSPTISLTGDVSGSGTMTDLGNVSISALVGDNTHSHDNTTLNSIDWSKILNKPDPTITLSGDLTGSTTLTDLGNATLSASVKDDSHNHIISNVDGLQSALDGKSSTSHTHSELHSHSNKSLLDTITNSGDGLKFLSNDGTYKNLSSTTYWGEIQGTLSSQTDLQNALNGKSSTSHNHDGYYLKEYSSNVSGVDNTDYTNLAYIKGESGLDSEIKIILKGTTSNVVVAVVATLIVNHSGDIYIKSESGAYTQVTIRVTSDGNDNYYIQAKTSSSNPLNMGVLIYTYGNETVTFSPSSVSGSTTLEHTTSAHDMVINSTGGSVDVFLDNNKVWHSGNFNPSDYLGVSAKASDSDKLDGISSGSFLRSDTSDTIGANLTVHADLIQGDDGQRDHGMYGNYDSYKISHIWSIGTPYRVAADGSNFGNLYGLAYKHTNNSTGGTMAGGHQMVWCGNGTPKSAIGDNVWTSGEFLGTATSAKYADIAEKVYKKENDIIKKGYAVQLKKGRIQSKVNPYSKKIYITSTNPAYKMGSKRKNAEYIAIKGSVIIESEDKLKIGDKIVSNKFGKLKKKRIKDLFKNTLGEIIDFENGKPLMWIY